MKLRGLYAITDSQLLADGKLLPYVEAALQGGARLLQYRDKSADAVRRFDEAQALAERLRQAGLQPTRQRLAVIKQKMGDRAFLIELPADPQAQTTDMTERWVISADYTELQAVEQAEAQHA